MNPVARYPQGRRATLVPRPVRADVRDYLAVAGASDSSAQIQAALNSGATEVTLGSTGTYRAAVTVPAGVTLLSEGAILAPVPSATARHMVKTGGAGAAVRGVTFDATNDTSLLGSEVCVQIMHPSAKVSNCKFAANGYRYGVLILGVGAASCDDGEVADCVFMSTSFGIYKDGAAGTTASRFKYVRNRFNSIRRGDAIELNVGPSDVGFIIDGNVINGVAIDGVANAGIGIGVAGAGVYGGADTVQSRNFRVSNNTVRGTEGAGIHVEAASRGQVVGNTLVRDTGLSQAGIEIYGSSKMIVTGNNVTGFGTGIQDDIGVTSGQWVISADRNLIAENDIDNCAIGIYEGMAGYRRSARLLRNRVSNCQTAISVYGGADFAITGNVVTDCPSPFVIDLAPTVKASVNGAATALIIDANTVTATGLPQAYGCTIANVSAAKIRERGNTFHLGSSSTRLDYHQSGDVVADGTATLLCTSPGWQQANGQTYYITAVAGNTFVKVVSPSSDPTPALRVGQAITIPGIGPGGAPVDTVIKQIYAAFGDYRIDIGATVSTTVTTSTLISLAQTATYIPLGYGPGSDQWLKENGGRMDFAFITPSTVDAASGRPTAATIQWSDGTAGTFTGTVDATAGDYTGWVATWAGSPTRTLTVSGVTYDTYGNQLGPTGRVVT